MHKIALIYILLSVLIIESVSAQVYRTKFELSENENFSVNPLENRYDHQAIPIISSDDNSIVLLAATSGMIHISHIRKGSIRPKKSWTAEVPKTRLINSLIGGFQMDSMKYAAVFTDRKEENFVAYEVDLASDSVRSTDFSFTINNERILDTFSASGEFFILTMIPRSSQLKIYRIFPSQRGTLSVSRYKYDFNTVGQDNTFPSLYKELMEYVERGNQEIVKITEGQTPSLATAGSYFKLHISDERAILTMDHTHGRTSVYEMILDSKLQSFQLVPYPDYVTSNPYLYTTNSALLGDTLVQMAISKDDLSVFIHDIKSEEMIAEYNIAADDLAENTTNLIFRNDTIGESKKPKIFKNIYKDLYKNQVAIKVHDISPDGITCTIGTTRPVSKSNRNQTDDYDKFRQSLADGISAFTIRLKNEENSMTISEKVRIDEVYPYEALMNYRKSKNIDDPVIESLTSDGRSFFYVWYSIFTQELILAKLPVGSPDPHYDLSEN